MRTPVGRTLPILAATLALAFSSENHAAATQTSQPEKSGAPTSTREVTSSRTISRRSALPKDWGSLIHLCREESRDLRKAAEALNARQDPRAPQSHIQTLSDMARQWRRHADALERLGRGKGEGERAGEAESTARAIKRLARETGDALSSKDKMGNFDVQEMMSRATQAQNLASSIQKDADKNDEAVLDKIG